MPILGGFNQRLHFSQIPFAYIWLMGNFIKYFMAALMCMTFFGKIGVPSTVLLFDYQLLPIVVFSGISGLIGNIIFVNLSYHLIKGIHRYRSQHHKIHSRRIFTPINRRIIRIKQRFGLLGISLVGPMLLSIPLSAYIAERFFKDKRKIILYFTLSEVLWCLLIYSLIYWFNDALKGWLV